MWKLVTSMSMIFVFALMTAAAEAETIHGCVNKKGNLRIVSGPDDCKKRETYISWSDQGGPPGPPGPKGDQGDEGPAGLACWDLNGDQTCDSPEDKNKDGQCDTFDCQGGVSVYDSSSPSQFLGVFLGYKHAPFRL